MTDREELLAHEVEARRQVRQREAPELLDAKRKVGAVVVTFCDASETFERTLSRLKREVAAVRVVDLSSTDDTLEAVARVFPSLVVPVLPLEAGYGRAVNEGAAQLDQRFLLVLHGDTRPRPGAVDHLLEAFGPDRRRVGCAGARLVSEEGEPERSTGFRPTARARLAGRVLKAAPRYTRWYIKRPARFAPIVRTDVDWVSDALMMVRREAFDAVGGMDEAYFLAYGGMDFGLRLRAADWRVVYQMRAGGIHVDHVQESRASVRRAKKRFYATHRSARRTRRAVARRD